MERFFNTVGSQTEDNYTFDPLLRFDLDDILMLIHQQRHQVLDEAEYGLISVDDIQYVEDMGLLNVSGVNRGESRMEFIAKSFPVNLLIGNDFIPPMRTSTDSIYPSQPVTEENCEVCKHCSVAVANSPFTIKSDNPLN